MKINNQHPLKPADIHKHDNITDRHEWTDNKQDDDGRRSRNQQDESDQQHIQFPSVCIFLFLAQEPIVNVLIGAAGQSPTVLYLLPENLR
jgi:hypothetical protein